MSPRTGRPPKENPGDINLNIRITREETQRIFEAAVETFGKGGAA